MGPQASSDYLSVQLGCSAAQGNLCYVNNNHTCSNTSPPGERERDSSPPEQGRVDPLQDGDRPPAHHLSAAKKHSRPSATAAANKEADIRALQQLQATSEDHKVHSVEKSPKPSCKMPEGSDSEDLPVDPEDLPVDPEAPAASPSPEKSPSPSLLET